MTRPYSLFKKSNGYYYVQFLLADGSRSQNKSTGTKDRKETESIAMRRAVLGDIPERINSKAEKAKSQSVDRISFFNSMSTYDFSPEEIDKMISITNDMLKDIVSDKKIQKLAGKTINGIVESITTPLKWAMKNQYIENITFYGLKQAGEVELPTENVSNTGKGINSDSFKLGVLFVLSELEKGRKKSQILKDKRIAKLDLGELNLSEEDVARISQRFGIA